MTAEAELLTHGAATRLGARIIVRCSNGDENRDERELRQRGIEVSAAQGERDNGG